MEKEGWHTKIVICDKLNKAKEWFEGAGVRWVKTTYHAQLYTPPVSPFTIWKTPFVGSGSHLITRWSNLLQKSIGRCYWTVNCEFEEGKCRVGLEHEPSLVAEKMLWKTPFVWSKSHLITRRSNPLQKSIGRCYQMVNCEFEEGKCRVETVSKLTWTFLGCWKKVLKVMWPWCGCCFTLSRSRLFMSYLDHQPSELLSYALHAIICSCFYAISSDHVWWAVWPEMEVALALPLTLPTPPPPDGHLHSTTTLLWFVLLLIYLLRSSYLCGSHKNSDVGVAVSYCPNGGFDVTG